MDANPYESVRESTMPPRDRKRRSYLVDALVVAAIVVAFVALMLPATRSARPAAYRMQCTNNLKQIGLALLSYESRYKTLPPARTLDRQGNPLHSWRALILPYVEQQALYDAIDFSKPWDDPANRAAYDEFPSIYACPSAKLPPGFTTYMVVTADGGCFETDEPRRIADIRDGLGETLIATEVPSNLAVHWMSPNDADDAVFFDFVSSDELSHTGGVHVVMGDGRVHFLSKKTPPETLKQLVSIAENETQDLSISGTE